MHTYIFHIYYRVFDISILVDLVSFPSAIEWQRCVKL